MKIDDGLRGYLIKTLQPLTEAEPPLVADYVMALLAKNLPKKELQKSCIDNLWDFLGNETKQFVSKLFNALDEGTISYPPKTHESVPASVGDPKTSPVPATKPRSSDAEESSDDEDDDRNHKHRRPRSRSFDRDVEEDERAHRRKRSRSIENYREGYHRRYRSREHTFASRIVSDGAVRGGILRTGGHSSYRGESGSRYYNNQRGRGGRGGWVPQEQRYGGFTDGPEFSSVLLPQGPTGSNIFVNRVPGGTIPASLEHVIPLSSGGFSTVNPLVVAAIPRPRCLDFEERGYCLRGDLCPMEHGANRIVVDDVQSLSKLTLPGSTRNGASGSAVATTGGRPSREGDEANPGSEYDPDQPLWGKDAQGKQTYQQRQQWENSSDLKNAAMEEASKQNEAKGLESGVSVWDRIGPVESSVKKEQGSGEKSGTDENSNGNVPQGERPHVPRSAEGTSYGGRDRGEKAQRTLYVRCIPSESNKSELLRSHFQKFGEVIDVRVPPHHSDRAFVQFSRKEDAEAAVVSPEAVFGNRFIRVSWANRDNKAAPAGSGSKLNGGRPSSNGNADMPTTTTTTTTPSSSISAAVVAQNQKKLEELEQMKEEIRKKQEALAQRRDEFKRRLDKIAKQENTVTEEEAGKSSVGQALPKTPKSPFPRAGNPNQPWGPARYKLDNRTTMFKFSVPPSAVDIAALKAHFGMFGEVSNLEAEENSANNGTTSIQVTFSARRDAEKAFVHGRMWQGQALEPSWVIANRAPAATGSTQINEASSAADSRENEPNEQEQIAATTS